MSEATSNHAKTATPPWPEWPLALLARIKTGSLDNQNKVASGDYPFFVRSANVERINTYTHEGEAILIPGEGNIGQIFHYVKGRFAVHQRVYAITQFRGDVSPRFLFFYMKEFFGKHALSNTVKATVDSLRLPTFQSFGIFLPPLAEQRAIAGALSDAEGWVASLERLIAKKRRIKHAAMHDLLTPRRRLPGFTGEWDKKKLGEFGRCLRGVSFDPDRDLRPSPDDRSLALVRAHNIQNGVLNEDDVLYVDQGRVSAEQLLRPGDVVICTANGSKALVGKSGAYRGGANPRVTFGAFMGCFRPYECTVSTLIPYMFQSGQFRSHLDIMLAGSSINNLAPKDVEQCQVNLPADPAEQRAIAGVLSDMDAEIEALEAKLDKARRIKRGMMQQLLTGRVRLPVEDESHIQEETAA